jgi:hypothetical protein
MKIRCAVLKNATPEQKASYENVVKHQGMEPLSVTSYLGFPSCIIVSFPHIVIGIEPDGYAHS